MSKTRTPARGNVGESDFVAVARPRHDEQVELERERSQEELASLRLVFRAAMRMIVKYKEVGESSRVLVFPVMTLLFPRRG